MEEEIQVPHANGQLSTNMKAATSLLIVFTFAITLALIVTVIGSTT
jgi:hypothetical protein